MLIAYYKFGSCRNFIRTDEEQDSDESMEITSTGGDFASKKRMKA